MDKAQSDYTTFARVMHWAMALLILSTIPVGFLMVQEGLSRPFQNSLYIYHKNTGVLIFVMAVIRLSYRGLRPAPPLPDHIPVWQQRAAHASHMALYVLILAMPVAGYIRVVAGGFPIETLNAIGFPKLAPRSDAVAEIAKSAHFYGSYLITGIVGVHVLAALQHGLIKRDGVFSRMWPPYRRGTR
ncbi:cytochrome b561 [Roseivivax lentus]|uniref:Cytochrome b561 n=1 Tax=Roseivivax lentus TaxID=633194 RepID=A0A1N7PAC7_9RHOB|nr:cytochrome b [Roseivivax lentus]SIT07544.1 cytochrome b561 [Roseivivax lentus]